MNCSCEFLHPQPSGDWLSEEYIGYYQRRSSSITRPKVRHFTRLLNSLALGRPPVRVLELGAGEGDCVFAVNSLWPDAIVTAVESHPDASSWYSGLRCELRSQRVDEWLGSGERGPRFDLILMFDLLEHLRDPLGSVRALAVSSLAPGGTLVATFPNRDSWSCRFMRKAWFQYKVEHMFYFSRESVLHLSKAVNLETMRLKPLVKRLPLDYFLAVGAHFGPAPTRGIGRVMRALTPSAARPVEIPLMVGEWLWVARSKPFVTG